MATHSKEQRCPDTGLVVFLVFNWSCRSFSWTGTVVGNATNACSDNVHVMHGSRIFFPRVWGARGIFLSANPLQIRACVYIMIYNNTVYHICMYPFLIFWIRATLVLRKESLQFIYVFRWPLLINMTTKLDFSFWKCISFRKSV